MRDQGPSIRRVAVLTLGCKLNQADSEAIARDLLAAGCEVMDRPTAADAFIVNTCSVTQVADRKGRHLARLARRLSPGALVVLTGCSVETAGPALGDATGADLVLRNHEKGSAVSRLVGAVPVPASDGAISKCCCAGSPLRTRAFVRAQEGCEDLCAFCIVPRTRGHERSVPLEAIVSAVSTRQEEGVQEVVITGTQLGAYRADGASRPGPAPLLRALLSRTRVPRLRLSSLQPGDVTAELLSLWEDPRLCRHFHLALQSGSDTVLSRMGRRYTAEGFRRALALIRRRLPDAAITTDVMAGFPGESDADFEETYAFCREAGFAKVHVFPFSRRPGTGAARMSGQVAEPVKQGRTRRLLGLARDLRAHFESRFRGRVMPVLWERKRSTEGGPVWEGLTDNYLRVFTRSSADLWNRILPARLQGPAGSAGSARPTGARAQVEGGLWGDLL